MIDNERDIVLRWKGGDRKAYGALVRRYMGDAYLTALGLTGNPEDARDLSQDAFVKAYQARDSFDPERPFFPWLYRILKNHCLNFLQRSRRPMEGLHHGDDERERFAADSPTPLELLEREERILVVRAAIERLSFEHKEVIVLKNFRGYSYREMADILHVPIGTIMSRLYYARKALRTIIQELERSGSGPDRESASGGGGGAA